MDVEVEVEVLEDEEDEDEPLVAPPFCKLLLPPEEAGTQA